MKLFIFCAGKLLQWANTGEPVVGDVPSPTALGAAGDGAANMREDSDAEDPTGPPEHWRRLLSTTPPQPWLDLIRQKAPHLLKSLSGEVVLAEDQWEATDANQKEGPDASVVDNPAEPQPVVFKKRPHNPASYRPATPRDWLNRLHFAAPPRQPGDGETVQTPAPALRHAASNATDYVTDRSSGPTEASDHTFHLNPKRQTFLESSLSLKGKEVHQPQAPNDETHSQPVRELKLSQKPDLNSLGKRVEAGQSAPVLYGQRPGQPQLAKEQFSSESLRAYANAEVSDDTYPGHNEPKMLSSSIEASTNSETDAEATRLRFDRASVLTTPVKTIDGSASALSQTLRNSTNYREPERGGPVEVVYPVQSGTQFRSSAAALFEPSAETNRRNAFGPVSAGTSEPELRNNLWPSLPPPPSFEFADELRSRESESEGLQRLDREQRGVLWNA